MRGGASRKWLSLDPLYLLGEHPCASMDLMHPLEREKEMAKVLWPW
jgi:hypothetical protein